MGRTKRTLLALTLSALIILPLAGINTPSQAAVIRLTINGGPLALNPGASPELNPIEITGYDQETTGTLGLIDIIDARGTGTGWNLTAESTDFVTDDGSGRIDAAGFLVDAVPEVSTLAGSRPPQSFNGGLKPSVKLLSATPDTGMGHFQTEPKIKLMVPADVISGAYESTLTLTIATGP